MAGDHGAGQSVPVVSRPVERPRGGADDDRCIGNPGADHNIGSVAECLDDAPGAEVDVGGDRRYTHVAQRGAGIEVAQVEAVAEPAVDAVGDIVTLDVGDLRVQAKALGELGQSLSHPSRIQAAGVGDNLDAPVQTGTEYVLHLREEGAGVALVRATLPRLPQNQHRQLGEVVTGQEINGPALQHLPRRAHAIAPVSGAVCDPEWLCSVHR